MQFKWDLEAEFYDMFSKFSLDLQPDNQRLQVFLIQITLFSLIN